MNDHSSIIITADTLTSLGNFTILDNYIYNFQTI